MRPAGRGRRHWRLHGENIENIRNGRIGRQSRKRPLARTLIGAASILSMCGRYASFLPAEAMARIFGTVNPLPNLAPSWNVAPTQDAAVFRCHPDTGARHLDLLKWGL